MMRPLRPVTPSTIGVPLKEYLEGKIIDLDKLTDAKFVTFRTLLDSNAEQVKLALNATQLAIDKEVETTNERLALLNKLRDDVATKSDMATLTARYDDLKERLDKSEGKGLGLTAALGFLLAGITVVVFAANYLFAS